MADVDPREVLRDVQKAIGGAVVGYDSLVQALAISLASGGHVLLEGVPGLAKTYLVRTFAKTLALEFRRIQFTPDMLPSDIMGVVVLNPRTQSFEFRPGPIFASVVLADEINRAPPKVQSALLEAMQERQVTIEGHSYPLPDPFIVIATENPVEQEGTYPLPEAELDRFLFRLMVDYPNEDAEMRLLSQRATETVVEPSENLLSAGDIMALQEQRKKVYVNRDVLRYLSNVIRETRKDPRILVGASPRAGVQFLAAAKAHAMFEGRNYVIPEDVRSLAFPLLNHRIILSSEVLAMHQTESAPVDGGQIYEGVIRSILEHIAAPR
jgi:MoxR-like ATPase